MARDARPGTHPHPGPLTYVKVAVLLAAITLVEVVAFYIEPLESVIIPLLILLSTAKFALVAMFYMHLKFDSPMFTGLFLSGLLVAAALGLSVMGLAGVLGGDRDLAGNRYVEAGQGPDGDGDGDGLPAAGDATAGREVFSDLGCGACHSATGVTGATGQLGPTLDGIASRAARRSSTLTAEEYLRESILSPNAYAVEGFAPIMPSFGGQMSDAELADLIALLLILE